MSQNDFMEKLDKFNNKLSINDLDKQKDLNSKVRKFIQEHVPGFKLMPPINENGDINEYRADTKFLLRYAHKVMI